MQENENLRKQVADLSSEVSRLVSRLQKFESDFQNHQHLGTDGSSRYRIVVPPQEDIQIGCAFIDSNEIYSNGVFIGTQAAFISGKENPDQRNFPSSQMTFEHQISTNGTTNQSFIYGFRPPLYSPQVLTTSVTSGLSVLTDTSQNWTTDALAGAMVNTYSADGSLIDTRQIASNTANVLTIDGTWATTVTNGAYVVWMPVFHGAADWPWRQIYAGGTDVSAAGTGAQRRLIRFGYGTTSGADSRGLYMGTGSPESVVTANIGSLYLRTDGSTSTTLYVKTASNGAATGWTASGAASFLTAPKTTTTGLSAGFTLTPVTGFHSLAATAARTSDATTAITSGTTAGQLLILEGTSDANTITIKNDANTKLAGAADVVLGVNDVLTLLWDGSRWVQLSISNNAS